MKNRLSRAVTAIGLGLSLWIASVAALAQTSNPAKDQNQTSNSQSDQKDQKAATQSAPAPPKNNKPLSTNEDPTMIGKRNVAGGIWGKLAGGTEKEVRIGRQLAAEVE